MNFNHDTGLIDSVLTIDTSVAPPIGGLVQSLQVIGTGSLVLPQGPTGDRPGTPVPGMFRYNTSSDTLEYWNAATWATVGSGSGSGTVTSVDITGSTGISSSGGPITSSGSITLTLDAELQALAALASTGIVVRTGAGAYSMRTVTGTANNISITNGNGVAGNPTIDLVNAGTPVTASFVKITTDTKGRVTATTPVVTSDVTSLVGSTYQLQLQLYDENAGTVVAPVASGANSIALGSGSTAPAAESKAIGLGSSARTYGMIAAANGSFATAGDAQTGTYVLRNLTTNATPVELFLDGVAASQRLVLVDNSVYTFIILVTARRTDATGGGAGYKFEGAIRKDGTVGSTTLIGTPSKSILGETNVPWDVAVDADTVTGSLRVTVTGEAAKTVRWVATVVTSEVTN